MLISVIIATKNRYDYVNDLLNDLHKQKLDDYWRIEILVIDQSFKKNALENCIHIHTETNGPCVSRNIGVKNSKGEILVFLDDDARIKENFIKEIIKPILEAKSKAVAGAVCDVNGNYPKKSHEFWKQKNFNFIKVLTSNPDMEKSRPTLSFPAGCSAIEKDVFLSLGGFDETLDPTGAGEDRDFALNLFVNGYGIYYNHQAKLYHIGANTGGSRDYGERTLNLQVHTVYIAKKYFDDELVNELRFSIKKKYLTKILISLYNFKGLRTNILMYRRFKQRLKMIIKS